MTVLTAFSVVASQRPPGAAAELGIVGCGLLAAGVDSGLLAAGGNTGSGLISVRLTGMIGPCVVPQFVPDTWVTGAGACPASAKPPPAGAAAGTSAVALPVFCARA